MRDKRKIDFARNLRKDATDAEHKLWHCLRNRALSDVKFRRQYVMGPYIADFCCVEKKLVVELDGGGHGEEGYEEYDRKRTEFLNGKGYRVLRFWDDEVLKDQEGVLSVIWEVLDNPHPNPLP